ncbi:MAG: ethanolamine ammonia-lyase subunit EutC [Polaromonas sp.]|nr:ethanolamine ammonia-lyase subunit EutC [Polaromonas sp.]
MTSPRPPLPALVTSTPWEALKNFTDARIALGRAGVSLPTNAHLAFQLAHAQARDAVHLPFDALGIQTSLQGLGLPTLRLHSQATDRAMYLQRPDLGRRLDTASLQTLAEWQNQPGAAKNFDLAFVLVDGLSALAIHQNAVALVSLMLQRLQADTSQPWTVAPLSVVAQGRVAIGDEVGAALRANTVVVLIGERPGLSSPDSMGLYLTWAPKVGTTDAARNCISNVRPAGLSINAAATTLHALLRQARLKQLTGIGLKDDVDHQVQVLTSDFERDQSQSTWSWASVM